MHLQTRLIISMASCLWLFAACSDDSNNTIAVVSDAAGASATLTLHVPDKAGSYDFFCPISNHRALGMTGTLVVAP